VDVKAMDCDFFVTGTLKYLLGPPGLAFLYVKKPLIEALDSTITSWMAQENVFAFDTRNLRPARAARRFEGGSPPIPNIYAAAPALELLASIGMENVAEQIEMLTTAFLQGAAKLGIASKTPADSAGPLVVLRARDPQAMVAKLAERGVLVSARLDGVRFSFHVYNNLDDVQAALAVLQENRALMVTE
jgi:aspartate aminotransferase-like enzyme